MRHGWICATVLALTALAIAPAQGVSPEGQLNCALDRADCAPMLVAIESAIPQDSLLAALRSLSDRRLAALGAVLDPVSAAALAEDETVFRKSLHRNLAFVPDDLARDIGTLYALADRLATRLVALDRINPAPAGFDGQWISATGSVTLEMVDDAYAVTAYNVEPDQLAWICEFNAVGNRVGPTIIAEAGGIDHIELQREGAALRLVHTTLEGKVAWSCGANGSLSGLYFRID